MLLTLLLELQVLCVLILSMAMLLHKNSYNDKIGYVKDSFLGYFSHELVVFCCIANLVSQTEHFGYAKMCPERIS